MAGRIVAVEAVIYNALIVSVLFGLNVYICIELSGSRFAGNERGVSVR